MDHAAIVRRGVAIIVALLLALQVVRNSVVEGLALLQPATAAKFWASHPKVEVSLALAQIGSSSRNRRRIGRSIFAIVDDAATRAPLAPEPFLVRGVEAQIGGDFQTAKRAFSAAQWRDPRSLPAAYFLANYYLRSGQIFDGLEQTTLLARLSPNGADALAPFLADYAQNRANWGHMQVLFRSQQGLEDETLAVLARNPRNADAILALADPMHRRPDSPWLATLLQSLIATGDYSRAREIWSSVAGGRVGGQLLYDETFSSPVPPPPFNWLLASSTVGIAERQPGNRLHVIFYGNDDGVLASELVELTPGKYHLQMGFVGNRVHSETLQWSLRCANSQQPFSSLGVDQAAAAGWTFLIPANCGAQWIELSGRSGDVAQQSEITITGLHLALLGRDA